MRVVIALFGAAILFYVNYLISQLVQDKYQIDKFLHIAMGFFLALFFSFFFKDVRWLLFSALFVGICWELFEFYLDTSAEFINITGNILPLNEFIIESLYDIFGDMAGAVFFVWWVYPHMK